MRISAVQIRQYLIVASICCLLVGMLCSFAAMSIGLLAIFVMSLLNDRLSEKQISRSLFPAIPIEQMLLSSFSRENLSWRWSALRSKPDLLSLSLVFFLVLPAYFYSENTKAWTEALLMKLPFLALPMAFAWMKAFRREHYIILIGFFFSAMLISAGWMLINYGIHYREINEQMLIGKPMPSPMNNHIRFGLMLSIASSLCLILWYRKPLSRKFFRPVILFMYVFFAISIHVLSARSGLMAFYLSSGFLFVVYIFSEKKWMLGIIIFIVGVILGAIAFKQIPSLKNRISYSMWSWKQYQEQDHTYYSDVSRMMNLKSGWALSREHVLTGVGYGDVQDVCDAYFEKEYPDLEASFAKKPHNQWLYVFLAGGVFSLAIFIGATTYPIFYAKNWKDPLFTSILLVLFSSFLIDHTLETQLGTAVFLLPVLLLLHQLRYKSQPTYSPQNG